jgi:hypothetical protein
LISCSSQPPLKARLVNSEHRAVEAEKLLDEAENEMASLEPDRADRALKEAQKALSDPDVGYYPEREMLYQRFGKDMRRLPEVRKEREARDLSIEVGKRQVEVDKALTELKPAVAALKKPDIVSADVDRAKDCVTAAQDALDGGKELESKDVAYGTYAIKQRQLVKQARSEIELSRARLEFIARPGKARQEAQALISRAKSEKDREKRSNLLAQARKRFAECAQDGQRMLFESRALAGAVTTLGDQALSPRAVVASCAARAQPPKPVRGKLARSAKMAP